MSVCNIEGLMYPVEYYVRCTRSMMSTQSQSCMDNNDSQRYTDSQLKMAQRRDSLTTPSRSKDSSTPRVTTLNSAGRNQMETTDSILESDSDTLRSQLSESKTPSAGPQECVDRENHNSDTIKLSRSTKNRRLQRRRGIGFGGKKSPLISASKNDFGAKLDDPGCTRRGQCMQ